ncbi:MAG TPA: hypothetical protein VJA27_04210 [Patescibacteria group bacterium]|nr:hypothetical protein [Patescibacteria group bacterium]
MQATPFEDKLQKQAPETMRPPRAASSKSHPELRAEMIEEITASIASLEEALVENPDQPDTESQLQQLRTRLAELTDTAREDRAA